MKAYIMEKVRKLRRMVSEENPVKKNIDFLKVVGHENYRHSMDSLDKASEKLNKTCMEAKQIIEIQWWRIIKDETLDENSKKLIVKELNECKEKNQKSLKDFEEEIDNMINIIKSK